jgi:hypothetical protein
MNNNIEKSEKRQQYIHAKRTFNCCFILTLILVVIYLLYENCDNSDKITLIVNSCDGGLSETSSIRFTEGWSTNSMDPYNTKNSNSNPLYWQSTL